VVSYSFCRAHPSPHHLRNKSNGAGGRPDWSSTGQTNQGSESSAISLRTMFSDGRRVNLTTEELILSSLECLKAERVHFWIRFHPKSLTFIVFSPSPASSEIGCSTSDRSCRIPLQSILSIGDLNRPRLKAVNVTRQRRSRGDSP